MVGRLSAAQGGVVFRYTGGRVISGVGLWGGQDLADWFEAGWEGQCVGIGIVEGVGGREVAPAGRVYGIRAEGYYGWVGGVRREVLFV